MKFKKSTQILFASALILATGVAVYEGTIAPDREAAELLQQQVFNFEVDRVATLSVKTADRTLKFDRLPPEEDSTTPRWQFQVVEAANESEIQTDPIPAKEAYVSFLLDALVNAKSDRILTAAESELGQYGLDEPQATIKVTLDDETTHQIQLGDRDFSESLVYAIADVPTDETTDFSVLLVSTNLENGVNRSLLEWQADEEDTSSEPTPTEDKATEETSPTPETNESQSPSEETPAEPTPPEEEATQETPPNPDTDELEVPPEESKEEVTEDTPPTPDANESEAPSEETPSEPTSAGDDETEETPPTPETNESESPPTPPEDEAIEETDASSETEATPDPPTAEPTPNSETGENDESSSEPPAESQQ